MKRLLTIGFALSGLLLIAWPFDVFAKLHGISPHIQLANRHVFHEEPTDFSFLTFFLYPGVWGVSLVLARRAIKEPVRKTRAMIWTLVPFAWIVVLGYTGNAVRYAKEEEWVRKDRKIGLLQDRISASNLSLSEREAAFQAVVEYLHDPDRSVQHYAFGALGRSATAMPEQDKETAVRILIEGLGNAHPEDCVASIQALERFGAYAEPALDPLLKIANGSDEVEAEFAIMSLSSIGRSIPDRVVPGLVSIVRRAHLDGTGVYQATFALVVLRQFPEKASEIVPALVDCSELPVPPGRFYASEFLEAWLLTMTALDPGATHYNPSSLDLPIITLLGEPNVYRKHTALTIVAKLKSPAPEVLKAIEGVANLGGTAKIRAEAQSVLAAANLKNAR